MFVESTSSMFLYSCNETLHMLTSESVDVQYTILSPVLSSSPSYVTLNFVSKFLSDDGGSISHCLSGFISNCLPYINATLVFVSTAILVGPIWMMLLFYNVFQVFIGVSLCCMKNSYM